MAASSSGDFNDTQTDQDLVCAGFCVFDIEYRLAPPGKIQGQGRDPGRYPEQTDDVATAIRAARNPAPTSVAFGRVNGKVGAVGGSAGASHAAYCAAAPTLGGDQLDAAVLLSGAYDFHDPASLIDTRCVTFGENVRNYVGCSPGPACDGNGGLLDLASPYQRFTSSSSPVFIVASNLDPMPPNQFTILVNQVAAVGVPNCRTLSYNTNAGAKRMHRAFLRVMAECERSGDCVSQCFSTGHGCSGVVSGEHQHTRIGSNR